jgi:hypothetical protein
MEPSPETPREFPQVTPRDLYSTADIRFVLVEIGKLTADVKHLISDVKSQGEKIDKLMHESSFTKGAVWVGTGLILIFIAIATFFLSSKWDAAVQALRGVAQ